MSRRTSTLRTLADFPTPTPQPTPCRLWQGPLSSGYGWRSDQQYQHRWVWEQINGPIPEGMYVLHRCDQPLCYRYDHLFLGTHAENIADMEAKGRRRGGSHPGASNPRAKLTADQVAAIRSDPRRSLRDIGADYGISAHQVWRIRTGRAWTGEVIR